MLCNFAKLIAILLVFISSDATSSTLSGSTNYVYTVKSNHLDIAGDGEYTNYRVTNGISISKHNVTYKNDEYEYHTNEGSGSSIVNWIDDDTCSVVKSYPRSVGPTINNSITPIGASLSYKLYAGKSTTFEDRYPEYSPECFKDFDTLGVYRTNEGINSFTYKHDFCAPDKKLKAVKVWAGYNITAEADFNDNDQILLNGKNPDSTVATKHLYYNEQYYMTWGGSSSNWRLPITNCDEPISLSFSSPVGFIRGTFTVNPEYETCLLAIESFSTTSNVINPYYGDSTNITGTITDAYGKASVWNATVAGRSFSGTGKQVSFYWDGTDSNGLIVPDGIYPITLNAMTVDGLCTDSKSLAITVKTSCDLKAILTGSGKDLPFGTGSSFLISGSYTHSSSEPIYWALTLPDGSVTNGTGMPISAIWNGNNSNGTLADIGTYSAVLTATSSNDRTCTVSYTLPITVTQPPDQCGLNVSFGSTAHVANGNLSHSQELFSIRGGALPLRITLHYNSLDSINSSLGRGWSHNYDYSLKESSDGSVLITEPNWKYQYFTISGGSYVGQPGNDSTLVKNADESFTLTAKDGQVSAFSSNGTLTSISDRNGNTQTFTYSGGNLSTVTDSSDRTVSLAYDANNHLTAITDPAGNSNSLTVDTTLNAVTQPDGSTWQYTYDTNAYMLTKTDPLGSTTTYTYDDQHRVITSSDPEGKTRSIGYPQTTDTVKSTTFTEKDGGVWSYNYDTQKGTLTGKTDPQGGVTSYTYDTAGNRTSTTNPDGTRTSATYDSTGNMLTSTDALGQTTGYTYNTFGQVIGITDPQGGDTAYAYDDKGNMTALTDPTGATTKYTYDDKGNITKVTDAAGMVTSFTYDDTGNLSTVTNSSGAISRYGYDAAGNVTSITDATGAVTTYVYDSRNLLIKSIDPNGNDTLYSYDANGNKISDTDANGNITKYEYNSKNQLIKTTDALGNSTTYSYGGNSCPSCGGGNGEKMTTLTDANGNSTGYLYDQLGRMSKETDPKGNATSYVYDAKGNLTSKTDANGNSIHYSYDGNGRLVKKTYPDSTEESYTYDAKGNILSAVNKDIAYNYSYDAAGRMTSSMDSNSRYLQYSYDSTGKKIKTIYPEGSVVSYAYDNAGRLAAITNGGGRIYGYNYDKLGSRSKLTYPSGATANYVYDSAGRLTSLEHKTSGNKIITRFSYTHDKVGNRLTKAEPDTIWNYGYDAVYRLLLALPTKQNKEKVEGKNTEKYSYDPTGNRLTGSDRHTAYTYGPGNELLTARHTQFSYDRNGNQIEKIRLNQEVHNKGDHHDHEGKKWTYTYDFENRLIKAETKHEDETIVVSFKYDPLGRRIEKKVEKIEHGKVEDAKIYTYVHDGQNIILEYSTENDDDHRPKTRTTKYVHGVGIDEHLSMEKNGEVLFYHSDGLGSVVALTDNKQRTVENYEYDSFGNLNNNVKPYQPFTYTGRIWDTETGLYDYRARKYDSSLGRFIQRDPIAHPVNSMQTTGTCSQKSNHPDFNELMKKPLKLNPYLYTEGNPINLTDPTGLSSCGSGWNKWFVPDNLFGWYSFTGPCSSHDGCYDCSGGKAGKSKADCDNGFLRDMLNVCSQLQVNSYWSNHCEGTAYIYFNAVVTKGQSAFDAGRKCCN